MAKGGNSQTTTVDPQSQNFINAMRRQAHEGAGVATGQPGSFFTGPLSAENIGAAMNPYLEQVIGGVRGEFDHLRGQALTGANQQATQAGAFGGDRASVLAGTRLGELDRAQTSQISGLLQGGYQDARQFADHQRQLRQQQLQEPLFRQQQALQMMNLGMGPVGQQMSGGGPSAIGSAAGGALTGFSAGGPLGAAIGGGVGLLGGLFG